MVEGKLRKPSEEEGVGRLVQVAGPVPDFLGHPPQKAHGQGCSEGSL